MDNFYTNTYSGTPTFFTYKNPITVIGELEADRKKLDAELKMLWKLYKLNQEKIKVILYGT